MVSWQRTLSLWKGWGPLPRNASSIHLKHADHCTATAVFWSSCDVLELTPKSSTYYTGSQLLWNPQLWLFLCEVRLYHIPCILASVHHFHAPHHAPADVRFGASKKRLVLFGPRRLYSLLRFDCILGS